MAAIRREVAERFEELRSLKQFIRTGSAGMPTEAA